MLTFVILMSLLCWGHAADSGTEFVTAFPENLAYYFPATATFTLKITTFVANTNIKVTMNGVVINQQTIIVPQVVLMSIPNPEVFELGPSLNVVRVTSDNNVTVLSISKRGDSTQSNVVPPTANLGTEYLIPSPNYTQFAVQLNNYNASVYTGTTDVPQDFIYRLVVINAEAVNNSIKVTGNVDNLDVLLPFGLIQYPSDQLWTKVSSDGKIAVIITNPCMDTQNCRCNMVSRQLRPDDLLGSNFIFPPLGAATTRLFVSADDSTTLISGSESRTLSPDSLDLLPYLPGLTTGSSLLTTSLPASVLVIFPGLIIDLIPNTMFSGCYLLHTTIQAQAIAVIIVETAQKSNVQMGSSPITGVTWNDTSAPGYSWGVVSLVNCKSCVVWHPVSRFGVYVFENSTSGVLYGGPAISISDEPDPNGCVVVPVPYVLSNVTMSWQDSRSYCNSKNMVMASPNFNFTQKKLAGTLNNMDAEGSAWLGLRRSLTDFQWYWQKPVSFDYANWDNNNQQPSSGLCVSMVMEREGNFTWRTNRCCSSMFPLCAGNMLVLSTVVDNN